jgi:hypothetical protein
MCQFSVKALVNVILLFSCLTYHATFGKPEAADVCTNYSISYDPTLVLFDSSGVYGKGLTINCSMVTSGSGDREMVVSYRLQLAVTTTPSDQSVPLAVLTVSDFRLKLSEPPSPMVTTMNLTEELFPNSKAKASE